QRTAGQEFERRAAAGRDVRDPIGHPRLFDGGNRIAAAHDRRAFHVSDGLRDSVGAGGERVDLEDAHRPVPDDRFGVGEERLVRPDGGGPDVDAVMVADLRVTNGQHVIRGAGFDAIGYDVIYGQLQADATRL